MKAVIFASVVVGALAIPVHHKGHTIGAVSLEKETMHTLESLVHHIPATLSTTEKHAVMENVEHMKADLKRIEMHAEGTPKHKDILKALRLRFTALKQQVHPKEASLEKKESAHASAQRTIHHLDSLVKHLPASLSSSERHEVMENVKGMKKDLTRLQTETAAHDHNLKKALHLRLEALKQQVHPKATSLEKKESTTQKNMVHHLDSLLKHMPASLSSAERHEVIENVKHMKTDLARLHTESAAHDHNLKKALRLRLEALKENFNMKPASADLEKEEETPFAKTGRTLDRLLHDLHSSKKLSAHAKAQAVENVEFMKADLDKMKKAPEKTSRLAQAMKLRTRLLRKQLAADKRADDEKPVPQEEQGLEKAERSINSILTKLPTLRISMQKKHQMRNNLNAMKTDLEQIHNASPQHQTDLKKALKLRFRALQEEVAEADQAEQPKEEDPTEQAEQSNSKKVKRAMLQVERAEDKALMHLNKLEHKVHVDASLTRQQKASAEQNLKQIKKDLVQVPGASEQKRVNLEKAVHLRMKALHQQLHDGVKQHVAGSSNLEANRLTSRVKQDIAHMRAELERRVDLPAAKLAAAKDNLAGMESNLEKQHGANKQYRERLVKALHLRMDALKQQLA